MDTSRAVLNADKADTSADSSTQIVSAEDVMLDSVTQIIPDGDVMLVVGPSQQKIQISSHFLKHISPVFRAMLDAPMKEGEALANKYDDGPVEIVLPEDKEQPMVHVLQMLYGSDPSARRFSTTEFREIAIIADKYGMADRLAIFAPFWLRERAVKRFSEIHEWVWNTLIVAYILKIDWAFFEVTKTMLRTKTSVLKFIGSFHDKHVGLRLGNKLPEYHVHDQIRY
ncbi:hypothetical protein FNAPI_10781 [Fusarium napiforme]|uniref:BTB domain-containing protein n=1 Tax=Fusarium napiforme TaxID=42672 RepID=A0A8H5MSZ2_9HYPO|nr:hypothetical protein FNAPI_10781 [Fusarium napiforme]